ncbi:hypothetical protein [Bradyrhizobium guangxiense]|uniref:hypothetical protein n=1 Tax=Bradyrhizobium guangxiense TaxID=1325115 RepID=UPI0010088688|nr:hypothetical protein [Bradyrhizobium guangxiense]
MIAKNFQEDQTIKTGCLIGLQNGVVLRGRLDLMVPESRVSRQWLLAQDPPVHEASDDGSRRSVIKNCMLSSYFDSVEIRRFRFLVDPTLHVDDPAIFGSMLLTDNNIGVSLSMNGDRVQFSFSIQEGLQQSPPNVAAQPQDDVPNTGRKRSRLAGKSARTKIGKSVLQNSQALTLSVASLLLTLDDRISTLESRQPNSDDAIEWNNQELASYRSFREGLLSLSEAIAEFIAKNSKEPTIVNATKTFAEGIESWWTSKHEHILETAFGTGLFLGALQISSLAGCNTYLSTAITGAIIGGKPVVDVVKAMRGRNTGR